MATFQQALKRLSRKNADLIFSLRELRYNNNEHNWERGQIDAYLMFAASALSEIGLYDEVKKNTEIKEVYASAANLIEKAKTEKGSLKYKLQPDVIVKKLAFLSSDANIFEMKLQATKEYIERSGVIINHFRKMGIEVQTPDEILEQRKIDENENLKQRLAASAQQIPQQSAQTYLQFSKDQSTLKDQLLGLASALMDEVTLGKEVKKWSKEVGKTLYSSPPSPEVAAKWESLVEDLEGIGDNEQIGPQYKRVIKGRFDKLIGNIN